MIFVGEEVGWGVGGGWSCDSPTKALAGNPTHKHREMRGVTAAGRQGRGLKKRPPAGAFSAFSYGWPN